MGVQYDPNWTTNGRSAYGVVPNQTALPDRKAQLEKLGVPVNQLNQSLSNNALNDLNGNVSYQPSLDYSAALGVGTGLQGSEFAKRAGAADYLTRVEQAKQRGATEGLNTLNGISSTQTVSPETQIQLGQENANLAAAPDPQKATNAALSAYQSSLNRASSYYSQPSRTSTGGGYAPLSASSGGSGTLSYPVPTAYHGTGTPEPSNITVWGNYGNSNSWNNSAFGSPVQSQQNPIQGPGVTAPVGSPMMVNGDTTYDPSYYQQLGAYQNPAAFSSGQNWSDFE